MGIIDTRQVIYDIERCISHVADVCRNCSYYNGTVNLGCMEALMEDALAILKEQDERIKLLEHQLDALSEVGI